MGIYKFLGRFFQKKINTPNTEAEQLPSNQHINFYAINYNLTNISPYIDEAKTILKINIPKIVIVPYLADHGGKLNVMEDTYFDIKEPGTYYRFGYYDDENGVIYITRFNPYHKEPYSDAQILVIILHELRHCWQSEYKRDEYYNGVNAVGMECIKDPSEIDADAFAVAYMEESKTPYERKDYMRNMDVFMAKDGGRRKKRINELRRHMCYEKQIK